MAYSKQWSVTFTKHIKQKRKVYQDGVLELSISGDKISLYDESENLIESKFVNKGEVVQSGKTLTMVAHIVDIGDSIASGNNPCNSNRSTNSSTHQQKNENKKSSLHRKPLHKVSTLIQSDMKGSKEPESGAPSNSSTKSPHSILKEWNVLYTTQLTQKAKKYHDGTLRLSQLGSHAKQVQLYDENERLLEGKVLKKDEAVGSGRTIFMVAHLIDIGDPILKEKDKHKPLPSSIIISKDDEESSKEKKSSFQRKPFRTASNVIKSSVNEWDVLYTTQLTQKAKKYHDGILRLTQVGTNAKQIILMSEESVVLGSRYLKSIECVESGAKYELSNYLIEVCGLHIHHDGKGCGDTNGETPSKQSAKSEALCKSNLTSNEQKKVHKSPYQIATFKKSTEIRNSRVKKSVQISVPNNNTDEIHKTTVPVSVPKPNTKTEESSKKSIPASIPKTLTAMNQRDARQILSILKRPLPGGELAEKSVRLPSTNSVPVHVKDEAERKEESSVEMHNTRHKSDGSILAPKKLMDDSSDCPSFDLGF